VGRGVTNFSISVWRGDPTPKKGRKIAIFAQKCHLFVIFGPNNFFTSFGVDRAWGRMPIGNPCLCMLEKSYGKKFSSKNYDILLGRRIKVHFYYFLGSGNFFLKKTPLMVILFRESISNIPEP
jgi:hypothetical protein